MRAKAPPAPRQDAARIERLRASLLGWYRRVRRDLPWRGQSSAYAVWLSEIMLQQTRVETVVPYYQRFLAQFPDVKALAEAPEEAVLGAWSGLGYYRRARLLQAGAQYVLRERAGELPHTAEELRAVPGIGAYTAGAIASIAFQQVTPLVDGNVERVLSRLDAIDADPRRAPGKAHIWGLAAELVDPEAPGDFNQGLMELGATLCSPRKPQCTRCPWAEDCAGFAGGEPSQYPKLAKRVEPRPLAVDYLLLHDARGRVLLGKRVAKGRFAGLFEPPAVEAMAAQPVPALARALGIALSPTAVERVGSLVHVLSHLRLEVTVHRGLQAVEGALQLPDGYQELRWVDAASLRGGGRELGVSTLARKVLAFAIL